MFIAQTRLTQTASRAANGTVTQVDPPVDRARFAGMVRTVDEAMSYIAPAQRPAASQWGGYELRYDLRCSLAADILGLREGAGWRVLVYYDVWLTPADRLAALPPPVRESLELGLGHRPTRAALLATLRTQMRDRIERLSLGGETGDLRDPRLVAASTQDDPDGVLADARTLELTRDIDTATSNPSAAPLLTMVPK